MMDEAQLNQRLSEIFFIESAEMLEEASLALLAAEAAGSSDEAINKVFRAIHSIKGGAQSLSFEELAEVAHGMEDFMVPFRQGEYAVDSQTVSLILESIDVIDGQLKVYQAGEVPAKSTNFLAKLAEVTVLASGNTKDIANDSAIRSPEEARSNKSRLLYLTFVVDQAAAMPGITAFTLLERLRQSGRLLYSQPDIDSPSMTPAGEVLIQAAIVETDMSNDALKQEAYSVGDIGDMKISVIENTINSNADKPTREEINDFNCLVVMMWKELRNKNSNKDCINNLVMQIVSWGAASRGAAGWLPGGLPAWTRLTSLLADTLSIKELAKLTSNNQYIALRILRVLWETVYHALCGQTYFYMFAASDILVGNGLQVITQLEAKAVDIGIIIIDLSSWEILEATHLKTLAQISRKIGENGWDLWLISEGEYTRRHVNVLEISESIIGQLAFYTSLYSAVLRESVIRVKGGNNNVYPQISVLIVDDQQAAAVILEEFLTKEGYDVHSITSPMIALDMIKKQKYHIILADVSMAKMNDIEFLMQVKKYDALVQVIMMASHSTMKNTMQCLEAGANDYIMKPVDNLPQVLELIKISEDKLNRWWDNMRSNF